MPQPPHPTSPLRQARSQRKATCSSSGRSTGQCSPATSSLEPPVETHHQALQPSAPRQSSGGRGGDTVFRAGDHRFLLRGHPVSRAGDRAARAAALLCLLQRLVRNTAAGSHRARNAGSAVPPCGLRLVRRLSLPLANWRLSSVSWFPAAARQYAPARTPLCRRGAPRPGRKDRGSLTVTVKICELCRVVTRVWESKLRHICRLCAGSLSWCQLSILPLLGPMINTACVRA